MAEVPDASPRAGQRQVMVAVALGASLVPLNSTMLFVALPRIMDEFGKDLDEAGWLITGYLIAVAALQTPAGKLGDRIGHRRVFLGGLVAFVAASAAAA
ncbi:MAG: MFS transporter, partial [Acidimicrobiia bacterium]